MLLINLKLKDLESAYITYQLRKDGIIYYVGTCRLKRIAELPDAVRHPQFINYFKPDDMISVESLFISNSREECHAKRIDFINAMIQRPTLNTGGDLKGQHGVPIICNETGEVFSTLLQVAEAHNCTLAALSNHLLGKEMYKTVNNRTYQRGPLKTDVKLF